jgi:hypothetical protein
LRLRFDQRELELLKGAEHLRGAQFAHTARPDVLRSALSLAKAGHKIAGAVPGTLVNLDESELTLLLDAVRFASREVRWATRNRDGEQGPEAPRYAAVTTAFPELAQKGAWRSFGLGRELDATADRLQTALTPTH